jgi:GNAT superfamily N-acetyltransferase
VDASRVLPVEVESWLRNWAFDTCGRAGGAGAELVGAMIEEMRELYGGLHLNAPDMPAADPGPPGGTFLVGYRDGQAVCGGGIKRLPDGACEIKRMYVVPAARGHGVAPALLRALEDAARGLGYRIARLDTGPRQPHAAIGNFNPVATFFGEKRLSG